MSLADYLVFLLGRKILVESRIKVLRLRLSIQGVRLGIKCMRTGESKIMILDSVLSMLRCDSKSSCRSS